MFQRMKDYIRPGAARALDGGNAAPSTSPGQFQSMQRDFSESHNRTTDLRRISQMRANISLELIARIQEANLWISSPPPPGEGAVLKVAPGDFISKPKTLKKDNHPFYQAAEKLNAKVRLLLEGTKKAAGMSNRRNRF